MALPDAQIDFQFGAAVGVGATASEARASARKMARKGATPRGAGGPRARSAAITLEGHFSRLVEPGAPKPTAASDWKSLSHVTVP